MRARSLALVTILVAVGALAVMFFFTRQDDRTRNDALLFLDRYESFDVDDPLEERRERVEMLEAIPFASDEVDRVRDLCAGAHRLLIHAEERTAEARTLFDDATDGGRDLHVELPTELRARIEAAIAESDEALPRARQQMSTCDGEVRRLRVRFQPRRRAER